MIELDRLRAGLAALEHLDPTAVRAACRRLERAMRGAVLDALTVDVRAPRSPLGPVALLRLAGPPIYRTFHHHRPDRGEEMPVNRLPLLALALASMPAAAAGAAPQPCPIFPPLPPQPSPPTRLPAPQALDVACPRCQAEPAAGCRRRNGRARAPHQERYAAAQGEEVAHG